MSEVDYELLFEPEEIEIEVEPAIIHAVSPKAKVEQTDDGALITITDIDGTTTAEVHNGADQNGVYPDLSAGNITGDFHIDTKPYLYRALRDVASHIGSKAFDTLIGGSVIANQLAQDGDFIITGGGRWWFSGTLHSITDGVLKVTKYQSNGHGPNQQILETSGGIPKGHKVYKAYTIKGASGVQYIFNGEIPRQTGDGEWHTYDVIIDNPRTNVFMDVKSDETSDFQPYYLKYIVCIDLTKMFGADIANRAYAMEQLQAGSGIAWLKSYGFLTKNYYSYNTGTLQSVKTTAHVTRNADNTIINNYPLDDIELRGPLKLVGNEIKYDGDVYEANGTVTRKYGYRAYEAGDESLANAITDGTHTVYKLNTPTTELADPFTSPQQVFADGTEEYIDNRTVPIPVGHETKYELDLASKLIGLPWNMSMIAPVEVEYKATRNYTAGQYLIVDNTLYKVTSNISNGGTITPNSNVTETTVATELIALV